jgi:hypothetical protein
MGIALLVGVGVVLAVVGDPLDHRSLDGHRAEDREHVARGAVRREGTVGQHPMKADGHAEPAQDVHQCEHDQVGGADEAAPQQRDGGHHHDERQQHGGEIHVAFESSHPI